MASVVTLTMNPSLDIASDTNYVAPDEKLRCGVPQYDAGGGGINVARAIKLLGGAPLAIFPAGGPSGAVISDLLHAASVDFTTIPISGATRENVHITEQSTGRQFRFVMSGPTLSEDEQVRCIGALASVAAPPHFLVASGSLPPGVPSDFYSQVEAIASRLGAKLVLDASGPALRDAGKGIYLLKLSLTELEGLIGCTLSDEEEQERAVQGLIDDGRAETIVVSLGKDGALLATVDGQWRLPSINVPVRSTVGAGDSMVAGIVMALTRGWSILDAVRYGIVTASAALMRPGTGLCHLADVDGLNVGYSPVARLKRCASGRASEMALSA